MKKIILGLLLFSLVLPMSMAQATYTSDSGVSKVASVTLTAGTNGNITWKASSYSSQGFKVVWSKNTGPTYPTRSADKYHYYSDPNKTTDTVTAFSGSGTYYVRVCEYLGGKCGTYSNQVTVTLGEVSEDTGVVSITVKSGEGNKVIWTVNGSSESGFKIVWSKKSGATYPLRDSGDKYVYMSDSSAREAELSSFDGEGTYYVRVCEYLGGKCGVYSNEIIKVLSSGVICTEEFKPVCGADGKTYYNECVAKQKMGVAIAYYAECEKDEELQVMEDKAELLYDNELDQILAELNLLRSLVKEQQVQITYLSKLILGISSVASDMKTAINNFIAYGVDDNTKALGEGERAAVMYSYKNAFDKLPSDEAELEDTIRIANGRWPVKTNEEAENKAKERFREVYLRDPDMNNAQDNAAVTIMAYGLRQKAKNRNLNSEKTGINTFVHIYGFHPTSAASHGMTVTEAWNIMQAITYSGASR